MPSLPLHKKNRLLAAAYVTQMLDSEAIDLDCHSFAVERYLQERAEMSWHRSNWVATSPPQFP
jgi:hypothetical protein